MFDVFNDRSVYSDLMADRKFHSINLNRKYGLETQKGKDERFRSITPRFPCRRMRNIWLEFMGQRIAIKIPGYGTTVKRTEISTTKTVSPKTIFWKGISGCCLKLLF